MLPERSDLPYCLLELTTSGESHTFHLPTTLAERGRNSVVECQLPKLDVAGSTPVARSKILKKIAKEIKYLHSHRKL